MNATSTPGGRRRPAQERHVAVVPGEPGHRPALATSSRAAASSAARVVELAVSLPAQELAEHLPHARRLLEAQLLAEHAAVDREPHAAQVVEVGGRHSASRGCGEERGLDRARRDTSRRRRPGSRPRPGTGSTRAAAASRRRAGAAPAGARAPAGRRRGGGGRGRRAPCATPASAGRSAAGAARPGRAAPGHRRRSRAPARPPGRRRALRAAPTASDAAGSHSTATTLRAQPRAGEMPDEALLQRRARQLVCLGIELEAEPGGVAHGPEDPGRIVAERRPVEDADHAALEVASAAGRVEQAVAVPEPKRHRVHGEVAAKQVGLDAGRLDRGQRAGTGVGLRAGARDVDAHVLPPHRRGAEGGVDGHPGRARRGARARRRATGAASPSTARSTSVMPASPRRRSRIAPPTR